MSAAIVALGSPGRSVLLERFGCRGDAAAMPPLVSSLLDAEGEALIGAWSERLTGC